MNRVIDIVGNTYSTHQDEVIQIQTPLTDPPSPPCQTRGMDMIRMNRQEIEALLRLLAEWEREELNLLMQERREAEQEGRLH